MLNKLINYKQQEPLDAIFVARILQFICCHTFLCPRGRIFLICSFVGSRTAWKPQRSFPSMCVQHSILFSAHFPTVFHFTFNFISHVLNGSQAAGPDPPMALWTKCWAKSPLHQGGHLRRWLIALHVFLHLPPVGLPERIIFNSRLSSLWQDGCYKHQPSLHSVGLHNKSVTCPPPSEKQAKQGLYLQRLHIPLIGLLAFKPGGLSPASLSLSSIPGEVPERNAKGRFHFNKEEMRPGPLEIYVTAWSPHKLTNWILEGLQPLGCGAEGTQELSRLGRSRIWNTRGLFSTQTCFIYREHGYFQMHIHHLTTRKHSQGRMLT